jgi:hypothetical protein
LKIDPYGNRRKFLNWKKLGYIKGVSQKNSDIIVQYLTDMEHGLNVARKGTISYIRLNNLKQRLSFLARELEKRLDNKPLVDVSEREIVSFFKQMRDGQILKRNGERYISVPDYVNVFKAFFHWYMRIENDQGREVRDITRYIDTSPIMEPVFVYLNLDEVKKLAENAKYTYKILIWFLLDSGIRAPTELVNIRVSDLSLMDKSKNFLLFIRDDISKTFGRKVKLLLCSNLVREYIERKGLSDDDYLFPITPKNVNQYLKRLAIRSLGKRKTLGGESTTKISLYDFRHASVCYWLPRYKSESAMKYRFGWKKTEMIHYYSKLLGMRDTICEQDLIEDTEVKTRLEQDLDRETRNRQLFEEQVEAQRKEIDEIKNQLSESKERDKTILVLLRRLAEGRGDVEMARIIKEESLANQLFLPEKVKGVTAVSPSIASTREPAVLPQ